MEFVSSLDTIFFFITLILVMSVGFGMVTLVGMLKNHSMFHSYMRNGGLVLFVLVTLFSYVTTLGEGIIRGRLWLEIFRILPICMISYSMMNIFITSVVAICVLTNASAIFVVSIRGVLTTWVVSSMLYSSGVCTVITAWLVAWVKPKKMPRYTSQFLSILVISTLLPIATGAVITLIYKTGVYQRDNTEILNRRELYSVYSPDDVCMCGLFDVCECNDSARSFAVYLPFLYDFFIFLDYLYLMITTV